MKAIEDLKALLCDPEGKVCVQGHSLDSSLIQVALQRVEALGQMNTALLADNTYLRGELSAARSGMVGASEALVNRDASEGLSR